MSKIKEILGISLASIHIVVLFGFMYLIMHIFNVKNIYQIAM